MTEKRTPPTPSSQSLQAQRGGLSPAQVQTIEFCGALVERIRDTGAVSLSVSFDGRGQPEIGADYEGDAKAGS